MNRVGFVVQCAGDEAGGGGFADTADACEHIGLRDAAQGEGIGNGAHHCVLADQVLEPARSILASEDEVAGAGGLAAAGEFTKKVGA